MFEESAYMKHFLFLTAMTLLGGLGSVYHPFWGILLYYALAVLRPQYLWNWALPVQLRWSLFAACIVLVSLVINAGRGFFRFRFNFVPVLILVYALLLMGSVVNAYNSETAVEWGIEYAKILAIALVTCVVVDRLWQIKAMVVMIVVCLGYIAWEINYLYFFEGRLDIFHKGYGGLDNNGAGLMLGMGVPLAYTFGVAAKNRVMRLAAWFLAVLMIHAMLMSYSRGAMISALVGVVWILIHHRPRKQAIIIALVAAMAVSMLAGQEIRDRFRSSKDFDVDTSAQSRFDSWAAGWAIATDHPLTGQGIRNSKFYTKNYGADRMGRTIHSQYIQIAADSGILAMITYVALLIVTMHYLRRSRRECLDYLAAFQEQHPGVEPDLLTRQTVPLTLGMEGSLLIFAFGGIFLSMEVVELPWLLMVMAGVTALSVRHHLGLMEDPEHQLGLDEEDFPRLLPQHPRPDLSFAQLWRQGFSRS